MNNLTYSVTGRKLTEAYEGLRLHAYQDSGGVWTVGYGHTGRSVGPNTRITAQDADMLLASDVQAAASCVNQAITRSLLQREFDALTDFCFNVGRAAFLNSHLRNAVERNFLPDIHNEFMAWTKVSGVTSAGLYRRRAAEYAMYSGTPIAE